jgi:hypothetical protein
VPRTKYTREVLAPLVVASSSLAEVIGKLGLSPTGGNHRFIKARIRGAHLDTTHFGSQVLAHVSAIPEQEFVDCVRVSKSFAQVATALALPTEGNAHRAVKDRTCSNMARPS